VSHFTKVKTQIKDMDILGKALQEMGFTVERDAKVRGYMGNSTTAPLVAKGSGKYDIGFNVVDGSIEANADWWGFQYDSSEKMTQKDFLGGLTMKYNQTMLRDQFVDHGYTLEEEEVEGEIILTATRYR